MPDSFEHLRVERDERGVVWIILQRPQAHNALSRALNSELAALAEQLASDSSVRVVAITGAGDKAFSAGADLKERKGVAAADTGPYVDAIASAINAIAALPMATIAMIGGYAFGGGLELALACDFRIAADTAEMGLTETKLGIMPGAGGTQRLPRIVGEARAKELILLGRRITAARAQELGLVSQVVPTTQLRRVADALIEELLAAAPRSVAMAKRAIERGGELPLEDGLTLERQCYDVTLATEDRNEGLRAFAEKRRPRYTGA